MTERATVVDVRDSTAVLRCHDDPSCSSCSSVFCNTEERTIEATVADGLQVRSGDQVDIYVPPSGAIRTGFFVLIFPLLMFAAAYLVFGFLDSEPLRVGAGVAGLVLGFLIVFLFARGREPEMPKVVRIIPRSSFQPLRRSSPGAPSGV